MRIAARAQKIEPFYVMEVAKAASALAREAAQGIAPMIFLNIGEPDFTAPPLVQEAAERAVRAGRSQYTDATGLPALRERISGWYAQRYGLNVPASRIVLTAGASAALQLACLALIEAGDEILMPDPSYPCNRHFVSAAEGTARLIPSGPADRFQLSAGQVRAAWGPQTRGVLLASPSNPTGTSIDPAELRRIHEVVKEHDGITLVDEIYLGLSYDDTFGHSALALPGGLGEQVISINSFSKYFGMTGWRLGWMVLPPELVAPVEKLAQNLYICPSTLAQHAALACFEPESLAEYEHRRADMRARRDLVVPGLNALGLQVPVMPDGAFYAWFDCSAYAASSWDFCRQMMQRAHIALTPGRDFGPAWAERYARLSFASSVPHLQAALERLRRELVAATTATAG